MEYAGSISHTVSGYECQHWHSQYPQQHSIGIFDYEFPENDIFAANNTCRNPDGSMFPWCYTMKEGVIWEYCSVPFCPGYCNYDRPPLCANVTVNTRNCKTSVKGTEYAGTISYTISGYECQAWYKQYPNKHNVGIFDHEFADYDVYAANNHCRNPNNDASPWCYTQQNGVKREYCSVPFCPGYCYHDRSPFCADVKANPRNCKMTRRGSEYAGNVSYTAQGHECLAWHTQHRNNSSVGIFDYLFPENDSL